MDVADVPEESVSDLTRVEQEWAPWIAKVAEALDVDASLVDVSFIHSLTQVVAHEFERPMAPVSAYIFGLGLAAHPDQTPEELRAAIVGAIPQRDAGGADG